MNKQSAGHADNETTEPGPDAETGPGEMPIARMMKGMMKKKAASKSAPSKKGDARPSSNAPPSYC